MTRDEIYQNYDGAILGELCRFVPHGTEDNYLYAFLWTAERNFARRVRDIVQSLCVWRGTNNYPHDIQFKMLVVLSQALFQAREAALSSWAIFSKEETPA
jgi:hypothetical protein